MHRRISNAWVVIHNIYNWYVGIGKQLCQSLIFNIIKHTDRCVYERERQGRGGRVVCCQLQVKLRALTSGCLPTGPQAKGLWRGEYHLLTKHGGCDWTHNNQRKPRKDNSSHLKPNGETENRWRWTKLGKQQWLQHYLFIKWWKEVVVSCKLKFRKSQHLGKWSQIAQDELDCKKCEITYCVFD